MSRDLHEQHSRSDPGYIDVQRAHRTRGPSALDKTEIGWVGKSTGRRLRTSSNKTRICQSRLHNLAVSGRNFFRQAPEHRIAAATRRAEVMHFAHTPVHRLHRLSDPGVLRGAIRRGAARCYYERCRKTANGESVPDASPPTLVSSKLTPGLRG